MTDDPSRHDPLADVINVLAAPIAGGLRSVEQFQRGIGELFRAVENLNTTLENLNETAMRVNRLVAEIEEPVRVMMPQVTRTIETADEITRLLEGPVRASAPQIERIADTLASPAFRQLPDQLGEFASTISDVSGRLGPLTQLAENAGGLLGAFRLPGMPGAARPEAGGRLATTPAAGAAFGTGVAPPAASIADDDTDAPSTSSDATSAKKSPASRKPSAKKKPSARKAPTKKSSAEHATGKKAPPKKSSD